MAVTARVKPEITLVQVPHPNNDGTWVEFHQLSLRQLEVLAHYATLIKPTKNGSKKRHNKPSAL